MNKEEVKKILNKLIILSIITLVGCNKDDIQSPTTLNKVNIQIKEHSLDDNILFNPQDKLIYFFTYNRNNSGIMTSFKINAFNYNLKKISAQRTIKGGYRPTSPRNSIGIYNNQIELYLLYSNKVTILNPIDLTEITSLFIPTDFISSVQIKNDLLFVSHQVGLKSLVSVYNRQDFTLISQALNPADTPHNGYLLAYQDILNENQIKCTMFPCNSTVRFFYEFAFDNQGNYLDFTTGTTNNIVRGNNRLAKTNDNVDFILTGEVGTIHQKSNLFDLRKPELNILGKLEDYFINEKGTYIYSIQNDTSINKYNASTFVLEETHPINEKGNRIFVDENQFIIFKGHDYSKDISFSFYQY